MASRITGLTTGRRSLRNKLVPMPFASGSQSRLQESLCKARPDHGWRERHRARRRSTSFSRRCVKSRAACAYRSVYEGEAVIGELLTTIRSDFMHGQVVPPNSAPQGLTLAAQDHALGRKCEPCRRLMHEPAAIRLRNTPLKAWSRKLLLHYTNLENNFLSSAPERTCRGRSSSRTEW